MDKSINNYTNQINNASLIWKGKDPSTDFFFEWGENVFFFFESQTVADFLWLSLLHSKTVEIESFLFMFRGSILNQFSFLESKHNLKRRLQQWSPQCDSKTYIIKGKRRKKQHLIDIIKGEPIWSLQWMHVWRQQTHQDLVLAINITKRKELPKMWRPSGCTSL